jgi:hypothetical protein
MKDAIKARPAPRGFSELGFLGFIEKTDGTLIPPNRVLRFSYCAL